MVPRGGRAIQLNFKQWVRSKEFREYVIIIAAAVLIYVGFRMTIQPYYINGPSMQPNYVKNEKIWVNKLQFKFTSPQRGNIIVFQPPFPTGAPYIKRVIGLPGESVDIKNGVVSVRKTDGSVIIMQEPYADTPDYAYSSGVIPANKYFVLGDNRNDSEDSHYGWLVSGNAIIGKAWLTVWPLSSWGLAPDYTQPALAAPASGK
jgi:signal peptidase I